MPPILSFETQYLHMMKWTTNESSRVTTTSLCRGYRLPGRKCYRYLLFTRKLSISISVRISHNFMRQFFVLRKFPRFRRGTVFSHYSLSCLVLPKILCKTFLQTLSFVAHSDLRAGFTLYCCEFHVFWFVKRDAHSSSTRTFTTPRRFNTPKRIET